jgi:cyanate permease
MRAMLFILALHAVAGILGWLFQPFETLLAVAFLVGFPWALFVWVARSANE